MCLLFKSNSSVIGAGKELKTEICESQSKGKLALAPIAESRDEMMVGCSYADGSVGSVQRYPCPKSNT